jgi:hypothetical protein
MPYDLIIPFKGFPPQTTEVGREAGDGSGVGMPRWGIGRHFIIMVGRYPLVN